MQSDVLKWQGMKSSTVPGMGEARKTKTPQESGEPTKEDLDSFGEWP
jgi:hypothetical protein